MEELPEFESIVDYVKKGLRRKAPINNIRAVLSKNKIPAPAINRAIVAAIDSLEEERKAAPKEPLQTDIIQPERYEKHAGEERKHLAAIAAIFAIFVIGSMIYGALHMESLQAAGKESSFSSIGAAFRSLFTNREYLSYCSKSLADTVESSTARFEICNPGAKAYDDYEALNAKNKEAVEKVFERVRVECASLPEELSETCSIKNPELMRALHDERTRRAAVRINPY